MKPKSRNILLEHKGLKSLTNQKSIHIKRTDDELQWRYFQNPFATYRIYRFLEDDYELLIVWRMIESFWKSAFIVDILVSELNVPELILNKALKKFKKNIIFDGAEIFECLTNSERIINALGNNFLSKISTCSWFLYGTKDMNNCPVLDSCEVFSGDCDIEASKTHK